MLYILNLLLLGYSLFYQYETPTYLGTSSLYSQNVWYLPAALTWTGYKSSITLTGILPYSSSELKHTSISVLHRIKGMYLFSGFRMRKLSDIYTEGTFITGGVFKISNISVGANLRAVYETLENENSILKGTFDFSLLFNHYPFMAGYALFNILRPDLTFSSGEKSKIAQRGLISLNYPSSVFFTVGYEKNGSYESPFLSTEVWFTHGFNVVFGIQNNTVEGGIGLRGKRMGMGVRIKSHTLMGPTYITYLSFYRE